VSAPKRRRKTAESEIANRIRAYAATYAATGEKEYARGILDAANMVDDLLSRGRRLGMAEAPADPSLDERVARLEVAVAELRKAAPPRGIVGIRVARAAPSHLAALVREAPAEPKSNGRLAPAREPASIDAASALVAGELRALTAIAQRAEVGATTDELVAMVGLRTTSIKHYLGNLRAGGYVTSEKGRHRATADGKARVAGECALPSGVELCQRWLSDGKLSRGEATLLRTISESPEPVDISTLFGIATGLRATSVKAYITKLRWRRLVVRLKRGQVILAPILRAHG
jgi:hypothetical protein